jgi:hypothetical protein
MHKLKKLQVEFFLFRQAWDRDLDYQQPSFHTYLDLADGSVISMRGNDQHADEACHISPEENKDLREAVASYPDSYLEIPGRTHGQRHDRLIDFTTADDEAEASTSQSKRTSYCGSIGRWRKAASSEENREYDEFCYEQDKQEGEDFLRSRGIEVEWIE